MLGLYPVVTQPVYLLGSPWFRDVNVTLGGGRATLRITSDGPAQSLGQEGFYVRSVKINGMEWDRNVSLSLMLPPECPCLAQMNPAVPRGPPLAKARLKLPTKMCTNGRV